jgi:SAM-dependent methyltransferase
MAKKFAAYDYDEASYRDWKNWQASDFGVYDPVLANAFKQELARSGVPVGQRLSILEIGFGNGAFAGWVRDQGWSFVGTELDPELVRRAAAKGLEVYPTDVDLTSVAAGRKFDAVVAFDVLEHLDFDANVSLLRTIKLNLAPDGRVIARFPSGDSPFSRAIQYGDITHRCVLGSGVIRQLADMAGLRVMQVRAPVFPLRGVGIVRGLRRCAVYALRRLVKVVVNVAFHDNQPTVIEPNMVVVFMLSKTARELNPI